MKLERNKIIVLLVVAAVIVYLYVKSRKTLDNSLSNTLASALSSINTTTVTPLSTLKGRQLERYKNILIGAAGIISDDGDWHQSVLETAYSTGVNPLYEAFNQYGYAKLYQDEPDEYAHADWEVYSAYSENQVLTDLKTLTGLNYTDYE